MLFLSRFISVYFLSPCKEKFWCTSFKVENDQIFQIKLDEKFFLLRQTRDSIHRWFKWMKNVDECISIFVFSLTNAISWNNFLFNWRTSFYLSVKAKNYWKISILIFLQKLNLKHYMNVTLLNDLNIGSLNRTRSILKILLETE